MLLVNLSRVQLFCDPMDLYPAGLLWPWDFPGGNTGAGCPVLLHGIFPTQGSNLGLLHLEAGSLPLSHQEDSKTYCTSNKNKNWQMQWTNLQSKKK